MQGYPNLNQQGGTQPAQGYQQSPAGQNGMPQGYPAGAGGYPYAGQAGGQPNYAQGGIPQGYPTMNQGYGPYSQMGRAPAGGQGTPGGQIPMNGAGYVPPPVQVRRQPFSLPDPALVLISGLLLILFAVGMFVPGMAVMKWVFLALAAGSIAFLWLKSVTETNKRLCFTVVFGVLAIVSAVSLATSGGSAGAGSPDRVNGTAATGSPLSPSGSGQTGQSVGAVVVDGMSGEIINSIAPPVVEQETEKPAEDTSAQDRLVEFFRYWGMNQTEDMLRLCMPSWQASVENPIGTLFTILANRLPIDYSYESITGTNDDTSRTITLTSTIDRRNGKDPVKYRLNVIMVKENDEWYVDPQSLKSYEAAETTAPPEDVVTPTPTPFVNGSTILYYNPDGGTKYHLEQNCKSTHEKYLPMKGHFTYAEINDDKYAALKPCNVCGAPLRP